MVPIFKLKTKNSDDCQDMKNYRPISLLSLFSKILEKVVAHQLSFYLQTNNILFENQYGYQRGKLTSYPMIKLIDFVSKAQNEVDFVIGVFCDWGQEIMWFKSFLGNRKQFVSIGIANLSPE